MRVVTLDPAVHRTGEYWHVLLPGIVPGAALQLRGARTVGAARGPALRFDQAPARPVRAGRRVPAGYRRLDAGVVDDMATTMKSVVTDTRLYDWEGDVPLNRPWRETIVYEAHLAGMTADPGSGVAAELRGTYAGLIEKIPYLADLGVTAIELLPVFQFDALAAPAGRTNYWGYQPISFFAPHAAYSSRPGPTAPLDEFRDMVKALHGPVSRSSSTSSTTTPPKAAPTARRPASGPRQRRLLPARPRRPRDLHRFQRDRQHVQGQRPDRPAADPRQPALLGRGDARRRLPLRPRGGPVARRGRRAVVRSADPVGDRDRSGPCGNQADRRGVGRRRALPGRQLRGRPLGGVERAVPRRHALVHARRAGQGPGPDPAVPRQPGHLRPQAPRRAGQHQLRHLPRRLHAERPRLVRRRSTTRRTARRTATAAT